MTNTAELNRPPKTMNHGRPTLSIAEIMLHPNRLPDAGATGVLPRGARVRPTASSDRSPISSPHGITAVSAFARASTAGYSSASHAFAAAAGSRS